MRILYFSRDYTPHDHRFLTALAQSEHQMGYLRLERGGQQTEDRPLPPAVQLLPWVGGRAPARWQSGPRLVAGLRNVIRDFRPDLILAGPVQRSALLVALTGFHPLVTMSWGYDLLVDVHNGRLWEWATRFTLKRSDALVGDCKTIYNLAVQYGMAPDRIVTFPWGADIQKYTPLPPGDVSPLRRRLGWGSEAFVLLSTRGWAPIYGVDDLARAFVQAVRKRPELRLLMLGNGPLAPAIHQIIKQAGVEDRVHFPGQIPQAKLPDFYRAADLYISTSHSDGTSISLLEALACGTPVLLTDIPGNKEWVSPPGKVGWLFRDRDVDSLREGILHAVADRAQLPAMGRAARQLAVSRANWDANFQRLFEAFEIALNSTT